MPLLTFAIEVWVWACEGKYLAQIDKFCWHAEKDLERLRERGHNYILLCINTEHFQRTFNIRCLFNFL